MPQPVGSIAGVHDVRRQMQAHVRALERSSYVELKFDPRAPAPMPDAGPERGTSLFGHGSRESPVARPGAMAGAAELL